jgi:hypothetical protein
MTMMVSKMESYFGDLAALLDRSLAPDEIYTCRYDAEVSDFVRLNRAKVRQPGTVTQQYLRLHLIRGKTHAEQSFSISGDLARDRSLVADSLTALRDVLADLPDDPHLDFATEVRSSRSVRSDRLPPSEDIIATVLDGARDLDLVGIYAAGPVYRGFANSLRRAWTTPAADWRCWQCRRVRWSAEATALTSRRRRWKKSPACSAGEASRDARWRRARVACFA